MNVALLRQLRFSGAHVFRYTLRASKALLPCIARPSFANQKNGYYP